MPWPTPRLLQRSKGRARPRPSVMDAAAPPPNDSLRERLPAYKTPTPRDIGERAPTRDLWSAPSSSVNLTPPGVVRTPSPSAPALSSQLIPRDRRLGDETPTRPPPRLHLAARERIGDGAWS